MATTKKAKKPGAAKSRATLGNVAAPKDSAVMPFSKSRKAHFDKVFGPDPDLAALQKGDEELEAHPDFAAINRVERALRDAHFDPVVLQSQTMEQFVFLMRELLLDAMPGMTLREMLEALHGLLSKRGGGRPPALVEFTAWLDDFESRQRANRTRKPATEIYQDIAFDVSERRARDGRRPVKWKQIRDGVLQARKARS